MTCTAGWETAPAVQFMMRHRQAVRQGTLTPPSQVRLLLAQLKQPRMDAGKIQCSCGVLLFYRAKPAAAVPRTTNCAFSQRHQRPGHGARRWKTQCPPGQFSAFRERNLCLGKGRQKRQMPDLPFVFQQNRLYLYLLPVPELVPVLVPVPGAAAAAIKPAAAIHRQGQAKSSKSSKCYFCLPRSSKGKQNQANPSKSSCTCT